MENKLILKEGDKVFHICYGWGDVMKRRENGLFWDVEFEKHNVSFYLLEKEKIKLLSFTKYSLNGVSQVRPEESLSKGQVVWVRDTPWMDWQVSHFLRLENKIYYVSDTCYDENERAFLYMTPNNPYDNECI